MIKWLWQTLVWPPTRPACEHDWEHLGTFEKSSIFTRDKGYCDVIFLYRCKKCGLGKKYEANS